MTENRTDFLEVLKDSYSAYYNLTLNEDLTELPLVFRADYFSRGEKYWITKSIKIWGNETNEYAYIFSAPAFDAKSVEKCMDYALADGLPRVKPHKEHQYTNFTAIFVADSFEKEAVEAIKKRKFSKSYKLSFHGFSLLKAAAVLLPEQKTVTNAAGQDLAGYFKKLFAARNKRSVAEIE